MATLASKLFIIKLDHRHVFPIEDHISLLSGGIKTKLSILKEMDDFVKVEYTADIAGEYVGPATALEIKVSTVDFQPSGFDETEVQPSNQRVHRIWPLEAGINKCSAFRVWPLKELAAHAGRMQVIMTVSCPRDIDADHRREQQRRHRAALQYKYDLPPDTWEPTELQIEAYISLRMSSSVVERQRAKDEQALLEVEQQAMPVDTLESIVVRCLKDDYNERYYEYHRWSANKQLPENVTLTFNNSATSNSDVAVCAVTEDERSRCRCSSCANK